MPATIEKRADEKTFRRTVLYFLAAIGLQSVLLLATPAQRAYTLATGRPVTLKTVPVDPYDPLRGYSVTLAYDISRTTGLDVAPGAKVYAVLEKPPTSGMAWRAVRFQTRRPERLPPDQVALEGTLGDRGIQYGLETYYVPEEQIRAVNEALRTHPGQILMDARVDGAGRGIPVGLRIAGKSYVY